MSEFLAGNLPDGVLYHGVRELMTHRDTFFRPLRNVRQGDEIALMTLEGSYLYRVDSIKVVGPNDTEVLDNSGDDILTFVTCYPF
jgi:sortase A